MAVYVSRIDRVLQTEDIEGLQQLGAPKDEYRNEAEKIDSELAALNRRATERELEALVANVWMRSFDLCADDLAKRMPAFRRVARLIREACVLSA